jgi:branched-chain amino acid aminotransferase
MFIDTNNRSFRYGDGFFETIRVHNGQILFWSYHQMRILQSLVCLHLQQPSFFSLQHLQAQILEKCARISSPDQRVRVTFFRQEGGLYAPSNNTFDYIIDAEPLLLAPFAKHEKPISIGLCHAVRLSCGDDIANCKTNSALRYVIAAQYAKSQNWDDAILLNTFGRVAETTQSNLWLVFYPDNQDFGQAKKNNLVTIVTPPLSEGCLRGVMRAFLLETLRSWGFYVQEQPIETIDLAQAKELWLTNTINGIRAVHTIYEGENSLQYQSHLAQKIQQTLAELMV